MKPKQKYASPYGKPPDVTYTYPRGRLPRQFREQLEAGEQRVRALMNPCAEVATPQETLDRGVTIARNKQRKRQRKEINRIQNQYGDAW